MENNSDRPDISLEEAIDVLREIALGDQEKKAMDEVERALNAYRSLYEAAEKKILLYRDVASKPDIYIPEYNKDRFREYKAALMEYQGYYSEDGKPPFDEWLFMPVKKDSK